MINTEPRSQQQSSDKLCFLSFTFARLFDRLIHCPGFEKLKCWVPPRLLGFFPVVDGISMANHNKHRAEFSVQIGLYHISYIPSGDDWELFRKYNWWVWRLTWLLVLSGELRFLTSPWDQCRHLHWLSSSWDTLWLRSWFTAWQLGCFVEWNLSYY
jgi:hypothetical protein